jgi:hypothetical protein
MPMILMPPGEGKCPECATEHYPEEPHQLGLYYQYHFWGQHGRWPTWDDAMAHCSDEVKEIVREVIGKR